MANTKPTIYIVDTENVGNRYFAQIQNAKSTDIIIICITEQVNTLINLKSVSTLSELPAKVQIIPCRNGQKEALDFQIAYILGNIVHKYKKSYAYRILSTDKGYLPLMELLRDAGYDAECIEPPKNTPKMRIKYGTVINL